MAALGPWHAVDIGDGVMETCECGASVGDAAALGDAVLLVGTALVADRLVPVGAAPILASGRRMVAYRRRGYGASSPATSNGALADDARDAVALMDALGIETATVVGFAYSAAVALQFAAIAPARTSGLCLIEPPPVHAACADEYRTANAEMLAECQAIGAWPAADRYLRRLVGRRWRERLEQVLPGAPDQVRTDAATFFDSDLPRLMSWDFSREETARIPAPTLLVTGSASVSWFTDEVCELRRWLPRPHESVVAGADHSLVLTHPRQVAAALAGFLGAPGAPGAPVALQVAPRRPAAG